jgi:glycosyltransferase involved in cell wall biosynthesis
VSAGGRSAVGRSALTWLSPGDPAQRTGGYLWNARVIESLRARGHEVEVLALSGRWPMPGLLDPELLGAIPDGRWVVADGLCWPGLGDAGAAPGRRCPVEVVVHSLLARETGLAPADAEALDRVERASWAGVRRLVATADAIGDPRTAVVIPGTRPAARARGSDGTRVLTVGTLTRRKAHDRLLDALARVEGPWTLRCAGAPRDPVWADTLARSAARWGERVVWLGDLDEASLDAEYAAADLVVQPAHYEAFGMAVAEAVARGLPVITAPAGVVDHLPPSAVRVTGDLRADLERLLSDPNARRDLADAAWAARTALPTWDDQAARLVEVLR